MKKFNQRSFIALLVFGGILFYYVLSNYDLFPLVKKALSPVIGGFVIAYLMDPMVRFITEISKGKIRRGFSILISVFIIIGMLILMGSVLIPSLVNSITDIVGKITNLVDGGFDFTFLQNLLNRINSNLADQVITTIESSLQSILSTLGTLTTSILNGALIALGGASSGIYSFFMAFIVGLYMLGGKADLISRVKRLNYAIFEKDTADELLRITRKSDEIFSAFFVGKIIDSAIIGVLCFILMWIFKIPNAAAIGFFVGVTNIIPYFGPFIGAVPAVLITLASGTFVQVFIVIALIVALQQFDGLILGPKILGDKVGVGAFWIIVSVTAGGAIAGVVGMLIGVPVVVLFKTLIEEYVDNTLKEKKLNV
ncbi:AI-2E family transporter [Acidaminobacter sp. JC074]|uniref:AI-2E family transporter n=1 Tax=Acidaminobacter sp. JC074 TaxID=2530199 RepID=UPI001F10075E|nr:AI-2E family transporter [Acidaminobacter sp. JC074]MCH4889177.1 AI-2E family transporter [Acidaminobacter sp. JC074]